MEVSKLFNVKGKVVLVTGGGKGIGRMISEGFVVNGAKVYIASRDARACEQAAAELNSLATGTPEAGRAVAIPADLSRLDEVQRLAAEIGKREKRLHVLVNNSGAAWGDSWDTHPDSGWTKVLTLNLQRVFSLSQALTPLLEAAAEESRQAAGVGSSSKKDKKKKKTTEGDDDDDDYDDVVVTPDPARVIHIGSIDALRVPETKNFAYSASKAGLHQLSRVMAIELGPRGITSNVIACGAFPSKMTRVMFENYGELIVRANPLSRVGVPEDVAGTCLFLASKAGAYVNGATIRVDGGVSLAPKL